MSGSAPPLPPLCLTRHAFAGTTGVSGLLRTSLCQTTKRLVPTQCTPYSTCPAARIFSLALWKPTSFGVWEVLVKTSIVLPGTS